jgi:hypothetical protein
MRYTTGPTSHPAASVALSTLVYLLLIYLLLAKMTGAKIAVLAWGDMIADLREMMYTNQAIRGLLRSNVQLNQILANLAKRIGFLALADTKA